MRRQTFFLVAVSIIVFLTPNVYGFGLSLFPRRATTTTTSLAAATGSSSGNNRRQVTTSRRDILTTSTGLLVVGATVAQKDANSVSPVVVNNHATITVGPTSVKDLLTLIEAQCDRRYWHAVVASDYRLLYYAENDAIPKRFSPSSSLLVEAENPRVTRSSNKAPTMDATDFYKALLVAQQDSSAVISSCFHKTQTTPSAYSFWPLRGENVHYGWTEDESLLLWSSSNNNEHNNAIAFEQQQQQQQPKLIVDGVDCGKLALEDALERQNGQVLVHANAFVLVPSAVEKELVARLQNSFLI